jgi:hypothetical protein
MVWLKRLENINVKRGQQPLKILFVLFYLPYFLVNVNQCWEEARKIEKKVRL